MPEVLGDSGPAVLLLPGGAEAVDGFFPGLIEGLQADPGCRVILYDRPGTGTNSVRGGLAEATAAIHATLAELDLGAVVIIGQSLGGAVALLVARDHPDDVAGLVLLDPTPVNDVKLARQVERTSRITGRLSKVRGVRRLLRAMLQSSANKSVRRHQMGPEATAAMRKIADVDLVTLGQSAAGLEEDRQGVSRNPAAAGAHRRRDRGSQGEVPGAQGAPAACDRPGRPAAVMADRRARCSPEPSDRGARGQPRGGARGGRRLTLAHARRPRPRDCNRTSRLRGLPAVSAPHCSLADEAAGTAGMSGHRMPPPRVSRGTSRGRPLRLVKP